MTIIEDGVLFDAYIFSALWVTLWVTIHWDQGKEKEPVVRTKIIYWLLVY